MRPSRSCNLSSMRVLSGRALPSPLPNCSGEGSFSPTELLPMSGGRVDFCIRDVTSFVVTVDSLPSPMLPLSEEVK